MDKEQRSVDADFENALFLASPWCCHEVTFANHEVLGDNDDHFGEFFGRSSTASCEKRFFWMKMYTPQVENADQYGGDSEGGYHFLAYDTTDGNFWYQHVTEGSHLSKKTEEYNPGLEIEEDALGRFVAHAVDGTSNNVRWRFATKSVHVPKALLPSKVLGFFSFRMMINDTIGFDYKFDCTRVTGQRNIFGKDFAHEHVISPFLTMILHLMTSQDELVETLEKKDKEIEDYKFQGATVSRANLLTTHFDKKDFMETRQRNMNLIRADGCAEMLRVVDLYKMVTSKQLDQVRNRRESGRKRPVETHQPLKTAGKDRSEDNNSDGNGISSSTSSSKKSRAKSPSRKTDRTKDKALIEPDPPPKPESRKPKKRGIMM